jgi:hypothetical protein
MGGGTSLVSTSFYHREWLVGSRSSPKKDTVSPAMQLLRVRHFPLLLLVVFRHKPPVSSILIALDIFHVVPYTELARRGPDSTTLLRNQGW